ncbi:hypothetical protein [Halomicronema sp. CCY15110]|uniref:hypothetical protein n=1 Tax=Halomicronema sp. CCY15110 TaxID=2767773 RepID=UPI00194EDDE0|nr:hypothetical protein [Halomicronema sp. CCY15110]
MKQPDTVQPDLFAPGAPVTPAVKFTAPPKPQADVRPRKAKEKKKSHRTESGDRCEGSIQIPGLSHFLCDRCGEWIATSKF